MTTHVLDAAEGRPAVGVEVVLEERAESRGGSVEWILVGSGATDADGRVARLGPDDLEPGVFRVRFASGDYFASVGTRTFYPEVSIAFALTDSDEHYHVPLLLSPFAYSTYRGS